jgi:hypothetical protein
LAISLQDGNANVPPNFIFVRGQLSGLVPGAVFLSADETVPVEIGVAQFKFSPLYSFEFGPDAIKNGTVTAVLTKYDLNKEKGLVFLGPNTTKKLTLEKIGSTAYYIKLPVFGGDLKVALKDFFTQENSQISTITLVFLLTLQMIIQRTLFIGVINLM